MYRHGNKLFVCVSFVQHIIFSWKEYGLYVFRVNYHFIYFNAYIKKHV